jgi:sulfonate transport system substrate-binding protein
LPALRAADRARFYVRPIDERIIKNLQATADRFATLGLIPKPIFVREAVRNALQS